MHKNRDGSILTCTSEGQIKLEKLKFDEIEKNNLLLKMAKFVIIDANSPTSKRQICVYDDIALKTPYGLLILILIFNNLTIYFSREFPYFRAQ